MDGAGDFPTLTLIRPIWLPKALKSDAQSLKAWATGPESGRFTSGTILSPNVRQSPLPHIRSRRVASTDRRAVEGDAHICRARGDIVHDLVRPAMPRSSGG